LQKCEHCSNWTDGTKAFCSSCGEILDQHFRQEHSELPQKWESFPGLISYTKLNQASRSKWVWLLEKLINTGEFLLSALILLVTLVLFFLPG
jgi:hypothetical protein